MSELPPPYLPQELVDEIALRLPPKSVARLRCVSKQWQYSLKHPQLAKAHIRYSHNNDDPEHILFIVDHSIHILTLSDEERMIGYLRRIESPSKEKMDLVVGGSCHGLFLLIGKDVMFLMNPLTLEAERVHYDGKAPFVCGLGYDESKDDYKIVLLTGEKEENGRGIGTSVDIYSVETKTWRRVTNSRGPLDQSDLVYGIPPITNHHYAGVFVNGCIHWNAIDAESPRDLISSFNLAREEFEEVEQPKGVEINVHTVLKVIGGGCLALVRYRSFNIIEVWVMKEYGVQDSWRYIHVNGLTSCDGELDDWQVYTKYGLDEWDEPTEIRNSFDIVCNLIHGDQIIALKREAMPMPLVSGMPLVKARWGGQVWKNMLVAGDPQRLNKSDDLNVVAFRGSLMPPHYG